MIARRRDPAGRRPAAWAAAAVAVVLSAAPRVAAAQGAAPPTAPPAAMPAIRVASGTDGASLTVDGRDFFVQGVNWDYTPIGQNYSYSLWQQPDDMIKAADGYLTRAGLRERARIEKGYALEVIPRLKEVFDLIFLDAVKEEYRGYLDLALPKLRTGGVVLCDNLLWGGQVAGEIRAPDQKPSTEALREFNRYFVNHPQLRAEVLAVGDGLGYGVKI